MNNQESEMNKTRVSANSVLQKTKGKKKIKIKITKKQRNQEQNARKQDQTQKKKVISEEWSVTIICKSCYR